MTLTEIKEQLETQYGIAVAEMHLLELPEHIGLHLPPAGQRYLPVIVWTQTHIYGVAVSLEVWKERKQAD